MKKDKTLREALIIILISVVAGFIANAVSSKGIPLVRDDSQRFKIDSASVNNESLKTKRGKLDKQGFHQPVNIPVELAKELFDENAVFIDGREVNEFAAGRVKGAINFPYKEFKDKTIPEKQEMMKDIPKDKIIVSYCSSDSCEISIDNAYEMAKAGYNDVKIYLGGYKEWTSKGFPTEK